MNSQPEIWIVDDERSIRWVLEKALAQEAFRVRSFENGDLMLAALPHANPDIIISDIRMPGIDGLALLSLVKEDYPEIPVIIMTAHSDLDSAVSSISGGAYEYLPKPFEVDEATALVKRALRHRKDMESEVADPLESEENPEIIGKAPAMQEVFRAIGRLSKSNVTVLINGQSGTGKELVARALHKHSPRSAEAFVALNMAAIPADLIESELFGHEKGAFTGATAQRKGRFELADGGTLFLDEVGELSAGAQAKLLRVLQDQEFERVGGTHTLKVNVRLVAATNRDLAKMVKEGSFRTDLYYRLNVFPIRLPSLRERPSDIPLLVRYFLDKFARKMNKSIHDLSPNARERLLRYSWPGNIRELQNVIERATILARGSLLEIDNALELRLDDQDATTTSPALASLEAMERAYILQVLERTGWVIEGESGAAAILDLNPSTLRSRMQKLNIRKPKFPV